MSALLNTFVTTNHNEFTWPCPYPAKIIPSRPPQYTGKRLHLARTDPDECKCDVHNVDTLLTRYKTLVEKERGLCKDIAQVNLDMTNLLSEMLENPASSDEDIMKSIYQISFDKRDQFVTKYRPLMAALDSSVGSPVLPVIPELRSVHRDPNRFRYSPVDIPAVLPAEPVDLTREPKTLSLWSKPFTGRSEYMDTISKLGLSNVKNQQQYREPLPSSRRRWGDCSL